MSTPELKFDVWMEESGAAHVYERSGNARRKICSTESVKNAERVASALRLQEAATQGPSLEVVAKIIASPIEFYAENHQNYDHYVEGCEDCQVVAVCSIVAAFQKTASQ